MWLPEMGDAMEEAGRKREQSPRGESEQVAFFEQSYERFLKAKDSAGGCSHCYRLGGSTVRLTFAGEGLISSLAPALQHLRVPDPGDADLTLCVWDSQSTAVQMIPPPCTLESFTDRGDVWGFTSSRIKFAFHWDDYSVNLMDHATRTGLYWVPDAAALPFWVRAAPLRTLFHWWMEKNGCQLLHGAAVGTDHGALLLTGKGGIGKSTTALSCLQAGLYYLGDDYLAVRLEPVPLIYSLYCTAKLHTGHIASLPQFAGLVPTPPQDGEKAVMVLSPQFERQIVREMPIRAVAMPRLTGLAETTFTPAPTWKIQRAASFTTMSQLPHVGRHTLEFVERLSSMLPAYTLDLGRDLTKIAPTVADLLKTVSLSRPAHGATPKPDPHVLSKPLVSVIIPVFNGERFIKDAVENIYAQDYRPFELIVVDDGSTDRTGEIIVQLPYDIRHVRQENAGPAAARNRGIREASGEFIAFLDADDLWPANNLTRLVEELVLDAGLGVVFGYAQEVGPYRQAEGDYIGNPKESWDYHIGSAVYRKSAFAQAGLFDATMLFGEDTDWFARANESNLRIKQIEEVTLLRRKHGQNMTQGKNLVELGILQIFKRKLDRKRAREAGIDRSE